METDPDVWESSTAAFVVRIWLEESADEKSGSEGGRAVWRGHITHVATGEKRYFGDLAELVGCFGPHLERLGIHLAEQIPCAVGPDALVGCSLRRWVR